MSFEGEVLLPLPSVRGVSTAHIREEYKKVQGKIQSLTRVAPPELHEAESRKTVIRKMKKEHGRYRALADIREQILPFVVNGEDVSAILTHIAEESLNALEKRRTLIRQMMDARIFQVEHAWASLNELNDIVRESNERVMVEVLSHLGIVVQYQLLASHVKQGYNRIRDELRRLTGLAPPELHAAASKETIIPVLVKEYKRYIVLSDIKSEVLTFMKNDHRPEEVRDMLADIGGESLEALQKRQSLIREMIRGGFFSPKNASIEKIKDLEKIVKAAHVFRFGSGPLSPYNTMYDSINM